MLVAGSALRCEAWAHLVLKELVARRALGLGSGQGCDNRLCAFVSVPGATTLHPFDEIGDFALTQLVPLRRHLEVACLTHSLDEQAMFGIPGNDRGAGLTALQHILLRVETESSHGLAGVAFVTVLSQDWANLLVEEANVVSAIRRCVIVLLRSIHTGYIAANEDQAKNHASAQTPQVLHIVSPRGEVDSCDAPREKLST